MPIEYQGPEGEAAPTLTIGFEGVKAPSIPKGKTWTPMGIIDSQIVKGVNDYRTLARKRLEQEK